MCACMSVCRFTCVCTCVCIVLASEVKSDAPPSLVSFLYLPVNFGGR